MVKSIINFQPTTSKLSSDQLYAFLLSVTNPFPDLCKRLQIREFIVNMIGSSRKVRE